MKPTSNRSGGLLVLLNKPRARTEVAGDKSAALIRFYGCLRDWPEGLIDRLRSIAYTVESFAWACEASDDPDPIESAARFLVRNRFSRGDSARISRGPIDSGGDNLEMPTPGQRSWKNCQPSQSGCRESNCIRVLSP